MGGKEEDFLLRLLTKLLKASFEINKQQKYAELLLEIPHGEQLLCIKFNQPHRTVKIYLIEDRFSYSRAWTPGFYDSVNASWDDRTSQAEFWGFLLHTSEDIRLSEKLSEWVSFLRALARPWSGTFFLKTQGNKTVEGRCKIVFSKVRNLPALSRDFMRATPT